MKLWIIQFLFLCRQQKQRAAALKRRQDESTVKGNICFSTLMKALIKILRPSG
jgi:hypothetical protein